MSVSPAQNRLKPPPVPETPTVTRTPRSGENAELLGHRFGDREHGGGTVDLDLALDVLQTFAGLLLLLLSRSRRGDGLLLLARSVLVVGRAAGCGPVLLVLLILMCDGLLWLVVISAAGDEHQGSCQQGDDQQRQPPRRHPLRCDVQGNHAPLAQCDAQHPATWSVRVNQADNAQLRAGYCQQEGFSSVARAAH